ncbi:hypothetical protein KPL70_005578 [Citrus sinensis]|nr:hypothetical protein KPL70_005578 [Citrus sinensis]
MSGRMPGPTSFAPIIETASRIVDNSGEIHTQKVTRSVETGYGQLSPQEQNTINAIAKARLSSFRTLLIFYASGDEPWDVMHNYDNNIPSQAFDNSLVGNKTEELIQFLELQHQPSFVQMPQQLINVEHLTILFTPKVVAAAGLSGNLKSAAARSVAVMDVAHRHEASMACEITIAFASSG